jgi:signal transduction histidine kinase
MLVAFRRFISPPIFDDEEKTRVARLLRVILFAIIVGTVLLGLSLPLIAPERLSRGLINVFIVLVAIGDWFLARRGYVRQAALLFAFSIWAIVTFASLTGGGVTSTVFGGYFIVVIFAGLLIGRRASILIAGASILSGLFMVLIDLPPPAVTPTRFSTLLIQSLFFFVAAVLLSLASGSIRQAIARAQRDERDLAERNRELHAEIVERKRVEEALRSSDARLRLALESARMRAWDWDIHTNKISTVHGDIPTVAVPPDNYDELLNNVHPDDRERVRDALQHSVATGEPYSAEYRRLAANGSYTWLEVAGQIVLGEDGKPRSMLGISHDITERKEAERHRLDLALQIERVALLTEFMGNVSHDLKTPLSVINTAVYFMEQSDDLDKLRQRLPIIQEQTDLLERYIQDIILMAHLEHAPEFHFASVDVNRLVREVMNRLLPAAEKKHLSTQLSLDDDLSPVRADETQLDRVLVNLVENALNYTPENGLMTLRTHMNGDHQVTLEICDTGIGIAEADLPRIFSRFYRADAARLAHKGGTGLGLAIVKKIVEMHSGRIEVDSRVGEGSTFRVILPVT